MGGSTTPSGAASASGFVLEVNPAGWLLGRFQSLSGWPGLAHAISTRRAPLLTGEAASAQSIESTRRLAAAIGLRGAAWCRQVHGGAVLNVDRPGLAGEADGLVTAHVGFALVARSADCPLVLMVALGPDAGRPAPGLATPAAGMAATRIRALGLAHASWRSTMRRIVLRTATAMRELAVASEGDSPSRQARPETAPVRILAAIAPSAGPCCYEVGPEVLEAARARLGADAERFFSRPGGRLHLDLWAAARAQLREAGARAQDIHAASRCTICRPDLFPSYRVEGAGAPRFAALLGRLP